MKRTKKMKLKYSYVWHGKSYQRGEVIELGVPPFAVLDGQRLETKGLVDLNWNRNGFTDCDWDPQTPKPKPKPQPRSVEEATKPKAEQATHRRKNKRATVPASTSEDTDQ